VNEKDLILAVHPAVAAFLFKDDGRLKRNMERDFHCDLQVVEDEELDQDEYVLSTTTGVVLQDTSSKESKDTDA
jgi:hypothetical protein